MAQAIHETWIARHFDIASCSARDVAMPSQLTAAELTDTPACRLRGDSQPGSYPIPDAAGRQLPDTRRDRWALAAPVPVPLAGVCRAQGPDVILAACPGVPP